MLGPSRPLPRVGSAARIRHFGGGSQAARVMSIADEGRRIEVATQEGEVLEFVLSPATARFVAAGSAQGPRLELLED